jgi:HPt (histidine-containing phosphotransfer) domain-containing protein
MGTVSATMEALLDQQQTMVFNRILALDRVGGDALLLQEISVLFIADYPRSIQEIQDAIKSGDAKALEHAAHGLKGAVSNFAAEPARMAAHQLEDIGRSGNLQRAPETLKELVRQFDLLHPMLAAIAQPDVPEKE